MITAGMDGVMGIIFVVGVIGFFIVKKMLKQPDEFDEEYIEATRPEVSLSTAEIDGDILKTYIAGINHRDEKCIRAFIGSVVRTPMVNDLEARTVSDLKDDYILGYIAKKEQYAVKNFTGGRNAICYGYVYENPFGERKSKLRIVRPGADDISDMVLLFFWMLYKPDLRPLVTDLFPELNENSDESAVRKAVKKRISLMAAEGEFDAVKMCDE